MSPGPLFAANITYGLREGVKSGIKIAIGHSIVELPLVIFIRNWSIFLRNIPRISEQSYQFLVHLLFLHLQPFKLRQY